MLAVISAVAGVLAPFLPDVVGMAKQHLDHKHELEMMRLRMDQAANEHSWRMQEIETSESYADLRNARRPHESYGVKLLNAAAKGGDGLLWRWAFNLAFLAFAALDWMISFVRPGVTFWMFGLFGAIKIAKMAAVYAAVEASGMGDGFLDNVTMVLANESVWTEFDQALLSGIAGFWFGERLIRRRNGTA